MKLGGCTVQRCRIGTSISETKKRVPTFVGLFEGIDMTSSRRRPIQIESRPNLELASGNRES